MHRKFDNQIAIKSEKQGQFESNHPQTNRQKNNQMRKVIQNYSFQLSESNIIYKNNKCKIYVGVDNRNQNVVAVKAVQLHSLNRASYQQLQTQIKYVKNLPKNVNLVNVFDILCTSNNCYFIMQQCRTDLKSYLKQKKVLSEQEFYPILLKLINAIAFLAQKNYIHANIKLSNILLTKQGAKLSDFSNCQKIKQDQQHLKNSTQWSPYMSPDTLLTKRYSLRNDIWALGVITYQCLHGYHLFPWKFSNFQQLLQKIYENNIKFSPTLSNKTVKFILKCLNPKLDLSIWQLYEDQLISQIQSGKLKQRNLSQEKIRRRNQLKINFTNNNNSNKKLKLNDQLQLTSPNLQRITSNGRCQNLHNIKVEHQQTVQDCINSQINFMRFVFIIYQFQIKTNSKQHIFKQLQNGKFNSNLDNLYFKAIIVKQILSQKQNLKAMFSKKSNILHNPFKINDFDLFINKPSNIQKVKNYRKLIFQYDVKYNGLQKQFELLIDKLYSDEKSKTQWRSKDILANDYKRTQVLSIFGIRLARQKCKRIWDQIKKIQLSLNEEETPVQKQKINQIQSKALYLDFMISYYLINCLLIDDFDDPQRFSKFSGVNQILNIKPYPITISLLWMLQEKLKKIGLV